ncbi:hypothetical protein DFJ74DRAFT_708784 [Hyaloraphidium curvatum]|nr:hypothetical protein DFJ74DRAFT_708784 [Hyaloraphidium curvatum]
MKLNGWLTQLSNAIRGDDGEKLARLLRLDDPHAHQLAEDVSGNRHWEAIVRNRLEKPWDDVAAAHVRAAAAWNGKDPSGAAEQQNLLVQTFSTKLLTTLDRRALPAVYAVCRDLDRTSDAADAALRARGEKARYLEEAARTINGVFGRCLNDRAAQEKSRRWGTYRIMTTLFAIYFRLGNQHLCVSLSKALRQQADMPALERFPMAHRVAFAYYQGVLAFFDEQYRVAEEHLAFAFAHCPRGARKNKYLILLYLVPARLVRGSLPEPWLLDRYPPLAAVYSRLVSALRTGDLRTFDEELARHEMDLVARGTYLTVERSRFVCLRNLFRKVYILRDRNARLPISAIQDALRLSNYDSWADANDVECVLANMIDKGYMKGYLSHEKQTAVLAKQEPFPPLDTIEVT